MQLLRRLILSRIHHLILHLGMMMTDTTKNQIPTIPAAEGSDPTTTKPQLEFLDIELTERCNLLCGHCYIRRPLHDQTAQSREMTPAFIQKLLEDAQALGCGGVRFTGGEALIRPDFQQIYLSTYNLGLKVSLATNATLLTDDLAIFLASHPPEVVSISMYGWDEASYAQSTGRDNEFANFLKAMQRLTQHQLPFILKYPPTKFLVDNSDKLQALAEQLGFAEILPYAWELTLHARNNSAANQRILAHRMNPLEAAKQRLRDPEISAHDKQMLIKGKKRFTQKIFECRGARKRLSIDAYGQLQACLEVRHPDTTYELQTGSLADALSNHLPKCRKLKFTNPLYLERCGQCLLRPACPLCPACSWMELGDLEIPAEYHCQVMHREAEILGLIEKGQKGWKIQTLNNT